MAISVSGACFSVFSYRRVNRIRAVASEDVLKTEENKVKLGGSELKVSRLGIGAWSWGDNTYWNNFEWDGKFFTFLSLKSGKWSSFPLVIFVALFLLLIYGLLLKSAFSFTTIRNGLLDFVSLFGIIRWRC